MAQIRLKRTATPKTYGSSNTLLPGELGLADRIIWYGPKETATTVGNDNTAVQALSLAAHQIDNTFIGSIDFNPASGKHVWLNGKPILNQDDADGRYVKKTGDTMTGTLTVLSVKTNDIMDANGNIIISKDASAGISFGSLDFQTFLLSSDRPTIGIRKNGVISAEEVAYVSDLDKVKIKINSNTISATQWLLSSTQSSHLNISTASLVDDIGNIQFTLQNIAFTDEDVTFIKNITINGNLTVKGTTTTLDTQTLKVADNIIEVNSNLTSTDTPPVYSGIKFNIGNKDTANDIYLVYNSTTGDLQIGKDVKDDSTMTGANLQSLMTRPSNLTGGLVYYNNSTKQLEHLNVNAPLSTSGNILTLGKIGVSNLGSGLIIAGDGITVTGGNGAAYNIAGKTATWNQFGMVKVGNTMVMNADGQLDVRVTGHTIMDDDMSGMLPQRGFLRFTDGLFAEDVEYTQDNASLYYTKVGHKEVNLNITTDEEDIDPDIGLLSISNVDFLDNFGHIEGFNVRRYKLPTWWGQNRYISFYDPAKDDKGPISFFGTLEDNPEFHNTRIFAVTDGLTFGTMGELEDGILTLAVKPATATTLGGIKVGDNLTITADGTLSAAQGGHKIYNNMNPVPDRTILSFNESFLVADYKRDDTYFTNVILQPATMQHVGGFRLGTYNGTTITALGNLLDIELDCGIWE